jgi:hypothetical protein
LPRKALASVCETKDRWTTYSLLGGKGCLMDLFNPTVSPVRNSDSLRHEEAEIDYVGAQFGKLSALLLGDGDRRTAVQG